MYGRQEESEKKLAASPEMGKVEFTTESTEGTEKIRVWESCADGSVAAEGNAGPSTPVATATYGRDDKARRSEGGEDWWGLALHTKSPTQAAKERPLEWGTRKCRFLRFRRI